jgi:hypothetical protein
LNTDHPLNAHDTEILSSSRVKILPSPPGRGERARVRGRIFTARVAKRSFPRFI